jgi:hypothetical protein
MWKHRSQLKTLAKAGTVAFGPVGLAATTLPETRAHDELLDAGDPSLLPRLSRLLSTATPAGKVYAASLIGHLDRAAGRLAWERLAGERSEVHTFVGCVGGHTTLAEYAADRLSGSGSGSGQS